MRLADEKQEIRLRPQFLTPISQFLQTETSLLPPMKS